MHRFLLDTNMVSYIVKGRSAAARARLAQLGHNEVACLSSITEGELRYGLAKNPRAEVLRASLQGFLAKIPILPWGREEAMAYGDLRAKQQALGRTLGALDMLIASHAIVLGAVLVTKDKAFRQVEDLPGTVDWAEDI